MAREAHADGVLCSGPGHEGQRQKQGRYNSQGWQGRGEEPKVGGSGQWESADSCLAEASISTEDDGRLRRRPSCMPPVVSKEFSSATSSGPTGLERVTLSSFYPKGKTFAELAEMLVPVFSDLVDSLGLSRSKTKCSGGIFPLPETLEVLRKHFSQLTLAEGHLLLMVCRSLNSYYGVRATAGRPISGTTLGVLEGSDRLHHFVRLGDRKAWGPELGGLYADPFRVLSG